jgi:hypothetical protein
VREGSDRETRGAQRRREVANGGEAGERREGREDRVDSKGGETTEAHLSDHANGPEGERPRRSHRRFEDPTTVAWCVDTLGRPGAVVLFLAQHLTIWSSAASVASPLQRRVRPPGPYVRKRLYCRPRVASPSMAADSDCVTGAGAARMMSSGGAGMRLSRPAGVGGRVIT